MSTEKEQTLAVGSPQGDGRFDPVVAARLIRMEEERHRLRMMELRLQFLRAGGGETPASPPDRETGPPMPVPVSVLSSTAPPVPLCISSSSSHDPDARLLPDEALSERTLAGVGCTNEEESPCLRHASNKPIKESREKLDISVAKKNVAPLPLRTDGARASENRFPRKRLRMPASSGDPQAVSPRPTNYSFDGKGGLDILSTASNAHGVKSQQLLSEAHKESMTTEEKFRKAPVHTQEKNFITPTDSHHHDLTHERRPAPGFIPHYQPHFLYPPKPGMEMQPCCPQNKTHTQRYVSAGYQPHTPDQKFTTLTGPCYADSHEGPQALGPYVPHNANNSCGCPKAQMKIQSYPQQHASVRHNAHKRQRTHQIAEPRDVGYTKHDLNQRKNPQDGSMPGEAAILGEHTYQNHYMVAPSHQPHPNTTQGHNESKAQVRYPSHYNEQMMQSQEQHRYHHSMPHYPHFQHVGTHCGVSWNDYGHSHTLPTHAQGGMFFPARSQFHPNPVLPPQSRISQPVHAKNLERKKIAEVKGETSERKETESVTCDDVSKKRPRRMTPYNIFFAFERKRIIRALEKHQIPPKTDITADFHGLVALISNLLDSGVPDPNSPELAPPCFAKDKQVIEHLYSNREIRRKRPHRKSHGKIGFRELVKVVSVRWRALPKEKVAYYRRLCGVEQKLQETGELLPMETADDGGD